MDGVLDAPGGALPPDSFLMYIMESKLVMNVLLDPLFFLVSAAVRALNRISESSPVDDAVVRLRLLPSRRLSRRPLQRVHRHLH